jgi:hypothetical protein
MSGQPQQVANDSIKRIAVQADKFGSPASAVARLRYTEEQLRLGMANEQIISDVSNLIDTVTALEKVAPGFDANVHAAEFAYGFIEKQLSITNIFMLLSRPKNGGNLSSIARLCDNYGIQSPAFLAFRRLLDYPSFEERKHDIFKCAGETISALKTDDYAAAVNCLLRVLKHNLRSGRHTVYEEAYCRALLELLKAPYMKGKNPVEVLEFYYGPSKINWAVLDALR